MARGKCETDIINKVIKYYEVTAGYMAGEDDPQNPGTPLAEDTQDLAFAQYGQDVPFKEMTAWPYDQDNSCKVIVLED